LSRRSVFATSMYPARNCSGFIIRLLMAANGAKQPLVVWEARTIISGGLSLAGDA
jgi:hypothetical protein